MVSAREETAEAACRLNTEHSVQVIRYRVGRARKCEWAPGSGGVTGKVAHRTLAVTPFTPDCRTAIPYCSNPRPMRKPEQEALRGLVRGIAQPLGRDSTYFLFLGRTSILDALLDLVAFLPYHDFQFVVPAAGFYFRRGKRQKIRMFRSGKSGSSTSCKLLLL